MNTFPVRAPRRVLAALTCGALLGAANAQDVLRLAPTPGTALTYLSTVSTAFQGTDVNLEAAPGQTLPPEVRRQFEAERAALQRQFGHTPPPGRLSLTQTLQVLPPLNDGSVVLQFTQDVPTPQGALKLTFRQISAPSGATRYEAVDGDDARLTAILNGVLQSRALTGLGAQGAGVYDRPLRVGETRTNSVKLDFGQLLGGVAASVPDLKVSGSLTLARSVTYAGKDAGGNALFTIAAESAPGTVSFGAPGANFELRFERLAVTGRSTYRPDGLPGDGSANTALELATALPYKNTGARLVITQHLRQTTDTRLQ